MEALRGLGRGGSVPLHPSTASGWALVVLAGLWTTFPEAAGAQLSDSSLRLLTPGKRVTVQLLDSEQVRGRLKDVSHDSRVVNIVTYLNAQQGYAVTREILTDSLARVWVASGTRWKRGTWIGGVAGVGLALRLRLVFGGGEDTPECRGGRLAGFTAAGAAVGGALGAVAGLFVLRWRLVY